MDFNTKIVIIGKPRQRSSCSHMSEMRFAYIDIYISQA